VVGTRHFSIITVTLLLCAGIILLFCITPQAIFAQTAPEPTPTPLPELNSDAARLANYIETIGGYLNDTRTALLPSPPDREGWNMSLSSWLVTTPA